MIARPATFLCVAALAALTGCKSMHDSNGVNTATKPTDTTSRAASSTGSAAGQADRSATSSAREASAPTRSGNLSVASMAFPTGDVDTSAILIKKLAPVEVLSESEFEYQIVVQNLTDLSLDNVQLTETLPANFRLGAATPRQASMAGGAATWNLGTLEEGATRTISIKGAATDSEPVLTCSSVTYNSGVCMSVPVVKPALELLAAGPENVVSCEDIVYTYKVTNTGTGVARDVVVDIPLPAGLEDARGRNALKKTIGNLAGGQSQEFTLKLNAKEAGAFAHTATANAAGGLKATAAAVKTVAVQPDVVITATGAERVFAGRDVRYTIEVSNPSTTEATDVVLAATLPADSEFKAATMNGRKNGSKVEWTLGTLAAGAKKTIELRVTPTEMGTFTSNFVAKGYCVDDATASVSSTVAGIPAILLEVVDLEDPILVGDDATYRITVTNQGSAAGHDIKIACQLPANVQFLNADGSATQLMAGAGQAGRVTFQPLASLAPKAKATFIVKVKGTGAADARFKVSMTSAELTSPVEETEATNYYQ